MVSFYLHDVSSENAEAINLSMGWIYSFYYTYDILGLGIFNLIIKEEN